jgi:signal transduction histidine kinase
MGKRTTGRTGRHAETGRSADDGPDAPAFRGLLHDLEHGLATLAALIGVAHGETGLPPGAGRALRQAETELAMLFACIADWAAGSAPTESDVVDVRALARDVAQLAEVEHGVTVDVGPGQDVNLPVSAALVWRVLANVIDNAARAAGPDGRVEVTIDDQDKIVVEVFDTGPGFGGAPTDDDLSGIRSTGLHVVTSLLDAVGGRLEIQRVRPTGTTVRAIFPPLARG